MAPREYGTIKTHEDAAFDILHVDGAFPDGIYEKKRFPSAVCTVTVLILLGVSVLGKSISDSSIHNDSLNSKSDDRIKTSTTHPTPFSTQSPEDDIGLSSVERYGTSFPSKIWGDHLGKPLPTNSWYQNFVAHNAERPGFSARVYTAPYMIDNAPQEMTGLRVHWPVLQVSNRNIQMDYDFNNGLGLGTKSENVEKEYTVNGDDELSPLAVSLKWGKYMSSRILQGMPYITMDYFRGTLPSITSKNGLASPPTVDDKEEFECGKTITAEKEVQLHFKQSDVTWIVFFSRPVKLQCKSMSIDDSNPGLIRDVMFELNVLNYEKDTINPFTVRVALIDQCTTGKSELQQHCDDKEDMADREGYVSLLRERAHLKPGNPQIDFDIPSSTDDRNAKITFDWNTEVVEGGSKNSDEDLLMFALPHHQSGLEESSSAISDYCVNTFHGKTCLVEASKWALSEDLGAPQSFRASRPPEAWAIPSLAEAVAKDIKFRLSDNLKRGAADTYFSGKILAKLARIITIASELRELASSSPSKIPETYSDVGIESYKLSVKAANKEILPTKESIQKAVQELKGGVQIWVDGMGEAPYVYDNSWGGLVNCGCDYRGEGAFGICSNTFPDCPALRSVNADFGNGFYNDHHFHYGYHVYAAAVAAKHDPEWGMQFFDNILLYIRDIANPSADDPYFTTFRHKDWFLGSSWASGFISSENSPHGRDQESSSEAIAAYEGVALYGQVMMEAFGENDDTGYKVAQNIRDFGSLLTATEVSAANRYWHVWSSDTHVNSYPKGYPQPVVGMLHQSMATFQTWFATENFVSYGIQMIPFTPVAESRDDPEWAAKVYPLYKKGCDSELDFCEDNGWTIIECGLYATVGYPKEALVQAQQIPEKVFLSEGGSGHSLTNTLWYISTRTQVTR